MDTEIIQKNKDDKFLSSLGAGSSYSETIKEICFSVYDERKRSYDEITDDIPSFLVFYDSVCYVLQHNRKKFSFEPPYNRRRYEKYDKTYLMKIYKKICLDNTKSFIVDLAIELLNITMLNMREISDETVYAVNVMYEEDKRRRSRSDSTRYSVHSRTGENILNTLIGFLRYPKKEPKKHMVSRGDTVLLPSSTNKQQSSYNQDFWKYLCQLYTDPEMSRIKEPNKIKELSDKYANYRKKIDQAKQEGKQELKKRNGENTDLSELTEKKGFHKKIDEENGAFVNKLASGELDDFFNLK